MIKRILDGMITREVRRLIIMKIDVIQNMMDFGPRYKETYECAWKELGTRVLELKLEIQKAIRGKKEK